MTPKRTSAAEQRRPDPCASCIVTMDTHLASAAERARRALARDLPGPARSALHAAVRMGGDDRPRWSAAATTSPAATSSSRRCCSWKTTSCRCCRRCRRAATHCDAMVCAMSAGRGGQAHAHGPVRHGRPASGPMALLKRLRGKAEGSNGQRHRRRAADEDAAPAAEDPALHPRHRAGRARLFPDAAVLAGRLRREHRATWCASWSTAMPTARARRCAAPLKAHAPVEYPEVGVYHPRMPRPLSPTPARRAAAAAAAGTRHGRPAADALLPAGRQRRPLRRRDRRAGSARPARHAGLRHGPGLAPGDRAASSCSDGRADGRRGGLADRLLAGRRPGLQRRQAPPRTCWRSSTCPTSPRTRSSSRRSTSGAAPSAACCRSRAR